MKVAAGSHISQLPIPNSNLQNLTYKPNRYTLNESTLNVPPLL